MGYERVREKSTCEEKRKDEKRDPEMNVRPFYKLNFVSLPHQS